MVNNPNDILMALEEYGKIIKEKFQSSIASEHTLRTPLENLLNAIKPKEIKVEHEAIKQSFENGTPDFKIFKQIDSEEKLTYPNLIGYIECKKLNEDLDKILKTPQIKKYLEISPNIIVTDYNRFILLSFDKKIEDITLFDYGLTGDTLYEHENNITQDKADRLQRILIQFFDSTSRSIKSKKELVKVLSTQAFYLGVKSREYIENEKNVHSRFTKYFRKTYESFKDAVSYEFNLKEFCDIFGQSIVYGLFVAHVEMRNDDSKKRIDEIEDFISSLPSEFDLLSEFLYFSAPSFNIPEDISYAISNIKKTIVLINQEKIAKELNTNIDGLSIYLYEDFLKSYDNLRGTENRKESGVFYTPEPVVKFIVSSINNILKEKMNIKNGFSQDNVKTLDFATGTGSFLAEVFETIIKEEPSPVFKRDNIRNKFLKDIYGFEMMFVPYIVAHLKLSKILKNEGFDDFNDENKLQIYLTNTLDLEQRKLNMSMPLLILEEEHEKAERIKNKEEVLVILGNPPYNAKSKNKGEKISALLQSYKEGLNEKNINSLSDDYIKFIRFAQWKLLEQRNSALLGETKNGVMGFITNNSFIRGRTHRKMRENLYNSFNEIYILNLHGSSEENSNDKNVFDIRTGVCISLFIKNDSDTKQVFYYSTLDNGLLKREEKFKLLAKDYRDIEWKKLYMKEPYYWFIDKDLNHEEYEKDNDYWQLDSIFNIVSSGITTANDSTMIGFSEQNIKEKITNRFEQYDMSLCKNISYRPFDSRVIYYDRDKIDRDRFNTIKHLNMENISLVFEKISGKTNSHYAFISDIYVESHLTGSKSYFAPLYIYEDEETLLSEYRTVNFSKKFIEFIKTKKYNNATPEEILAYIYALLFSPSYKERYYEYFKINYPKIVFLNDEKIFHSLVEQGQRLIDLHLIKHIPSNKDIVLDFIISSDSLISEPSYFIKKISSKDRFKNNTIFLNDDICISGVSDDVWEYSIGGYKVLDKWLKYRVGYECKKSELLHFLNMCKIICETIEIQENIDFLIDKHYAN